MTAIKICGLTRSEDIEAAVNAGADMLGLVFAPQSPRVLGLDSAQRLAERVPDNVDIVGVFMDQPAAEVEKIVAEISMDLLQFHGAERNEYCMQFGQPFLKAVSMRAPADLEKAAAAYPDCRALLLDSHGPGEAGGQGKVFDWALINRKINASVMLAGGLSPGNIADAIRQVRPWAVDVSSGVEMAPGIKDHALVYTFCENARAALND